MKTRRSALIFYCKQPGIHILLGKIGTELTTIGGGIQANETEIEACAREAYEETRGVVDYRIYPYGITVGKNVLYNSCRYFFIEVPMNVLESIRERFNSTVSKTIESNELNDLPILNLDDLIFNMLTSNEIRTRPKFKEFILNIGYHVLTNTNKVRFTKDINEDVELFEPLDFLPETVYITKEHRSDEKIYGRIKANGFYITDIYLFERKVENKIIRLYNIGTLVNVKVDSSGSFD